MSEGPEKPRHIDGRINRIGSDDLIKAFGSPAVDLAGLRAFVGAQRVRVQRHPDRVDQVTPSDRDYWRFLVRRQALEGVCVHYQTYDASGDENDWNINIAPDPAYSWLLDPGILEALALSAGAPPFDPSGHTALNAANIMFEIVCATALAYAKRRDAGEGA